MTTHTLHRTASSQRSSLFSRIASAYAVYRQRRQLAALDAHMRADLGLLESDILREVNRSVWDVPAVWRG